MRTPTTPVKKDGHQWFDVGIIKGTSCVVSHYYLSAYTQGANGEVSQMWGSLRARRVLCRIITCRPTHREPMVR